MSDLGRLIWCAMVGLVSSRAPLHAEILVLRYQLNVLTRKSPKRVAFGNIDRLLFVGLYRFSPKLLEALKILKPEIGREDMVWGRLPVLVSSTC
jgi:hypothetical protein